jgi:hypothetical protein
MDLDLRLCQENPQAKRATPGSAERPLDDESVGAPVAEAHGQKPLRIGGAIPSHPRPPTSSIRPSSLLAPAALVARCLEPDAPGGRELTRPGDAAVMLPLPDHPGRWGPSPVSNHGPATLGGLTHRVSSRVEPTR